MGYDDDIVDYIKKEMELEDLALRISLQQAMGGPLAGLFSSSGKNTSTADFFEKLLGTKSAKLSAAEVQEKNASIQTTNSGVKVRNGTSYGHLYPKYTKDGNFPKDFESAKSFHELKEMGLGTIDKILNDYGLTSQAMSMQQLGFVSPFGNRNISVLNLMASSSLGGIGGTMGGFGNSREKDHKLQILVEFLGGEYEDDPFANILGNLGKGRRYGI